MSITEKEQQILSAIHVASENDPEKPEFPADDPKFPATPTIKIDIDGFGDVWLKDESKNPTGTHKDRMAWEIVVTYRDFLMAKKLGQINGPLPQMSIISSGSAATAIQTLLSRYGLPNLKVLLDKKIKSDIRCHLQNLGCEIYQANLSKRPLKWHEILKLTDNVDGFDITSSDALDPTLRFYDWLSYEIINSSPDYCFIPFGTGNLFENVLNINKREVTTKNHDPRFSGDVEKLRRCNFFGATTNNKYSKAEKLYSPHLPFVHFDQQWIKIYRYSGFCGPDSDVISIEEKYLDQAMQIARIQEIDCEHSGIAGLALMLQLAPKLPRDRKMLVINTGKTKYNA